MIRGRYSREPRNKCSCCKKFKNIHWRDYWAGGSAALCFSCINFLGWDKEKESIIKDTNICTKCGDRFVSKGDWQKECTVCWLKRTGKIKEEERFVQQSI